MEIRTLDRSVVEEAEEQRNRGNLKEAIKLVDQELYPSRKLLKPSDIDQIARDAKQASILAELARIRTNSSISLANQSFIPPIVIGHLARAINTIEDIYRHRVLRPALVRVQNPQNFLLEMRRDEIKAVQSIAQFSMGWKKRALLAQSEDMLDASAASLPEDDQVRNLMIIEQAISQMDRGVAFDEKTLIPSIIQLLEDASLDPHRRQTVAAWIRARQTQLDDTRTKILAAHTYHQLKEEYPQHGPIYEKTVQKIAVQPWRSMWLCGMAPFTTWPGQIDNLQDKLLHGS